MIKKRCECPSKGGGDIMVESELSSESLGAIIIIIMIMVSTVCIMYYTYLVGVYNNEMTKTAFGKCLLSCENLHDDDESECVMNCIDILGLCE